MANEECRRRLIVAEGRPDPAAATDLLGAALREPVRLRASAEPESGEPWCVLLAVHEGAPGIVSAFHERGQLVEFGADPAQIVADATVAAEFTTLLERLCFRHQLLVLEPAAPRLAPLVERVARDRGLTLRPPAAARHSA